MATRPGTDLTESGPARHRPPPFAPPAVRTVLRTDRLRGPVAGDRPLLQRTDRERADRETGRRAYASPTVSNSELSSASLALLPAQTTNWKA